MQIKLFDYAVSVGEECGEKLTLGGLHVKAFDLEDLTRHSGLQRID